MLLHETSPGLFGDLPVHRAPSTPFVNLYALVPHLLEIYPEWNEQDLGHFVEEKTGQRLHPEDQIILRTVHQRCIRLRNEFEIE